MAAASQAVSGSPVRARGPVREGDDEGAGQDKGQAPGPTGRAGACSGHMVTGWFHGCPRRTSGPIPNWPGRCLLRRSPSPIRRPRKSLRPTESRPIRSRTSWCGRVPTIGGGQTRSCRARGSARRVALDRILRPAAGGAGNRKLRPGACITCRLSGERAVPGTLPAPRGEHPAGHEASRTGPAHLRKELHDPLGFAISLRPGDSAPPTLHDRPRPLPAGGPRPERLQ